MKMERALVLFNIESGSKNQVLKNIKKVEGVEEAYFSCCKYDLAAKVKADSWETLEDVIINKLRQIEKVRSTTSLILIEK
ncbi:MAG: Lrp/AsnC ligand binding domain-containing protein [Candidatus Bathyarchaeota archaeon]|jgi:DNA-binding Lrp family transcriptional regulator|nr:Lrp/AsnC ligand binding domain-containing protein [Candidatus Bathyarchaeota archaeon]